VPHQAPTIGRTPYFAAVFIVSHVSPARFTRSAISCAVILAAGLSLNCSTNPETR
jgi:hypothetical protein